MTTLLDNILESESILKRIITEENTELLAVVENIRHHGIERLTLVGSGTSCHAGLFVEKTFNEETNCILNSYFPHEIMESNHLLKESQLVIGLSQSGMSASTHTALLQAKKLGIPTVLISSNQASMSRDVADQFILLDCGKEEAVAKTKGFTASCALLLKLAFELSANKEPLEKKLLSVVDQIPQVIDQTQQWFKNNEEDLTKAPYFYMVGTADHIGNLKEAGLKLIETLRVPIVAFEMEEFMHGIYNAITPNSHLFFIDSSDKYSERMLELYRYLNKKTPYCYLVTDQPTNNPRNLSVGRRVEEGFDTFLYAIVFQVLCHYGAIGRGINPTISGDKDFHPSMKSKIN